MNQLGAARVEDNQSHLDHDGLLTEIVVAAQRGDPHAFEELVRALGPPTYRFLIVHLGQEADARDALQETLIAAWGGLPALNQPESFRSWLLTIALRKAHATIRRRPPTLIGHAPEGTPDSAGLFEFGAALRSLPVPMRDVLVLRYLVGLSEEETAVVTGVRKGTVKSRSARARERLAELLEEPDERGRVMKAADVMDEDRLRDSMEKLGDAAPRLGIEELARMSARAFSNNAPRRRTQWRVRRLTILTAVFVGLGAMTAYATLNLGQVTFAEYEQAYIEYADCIRAAGYTVEGPTQFGRDPGGHIVLYVGVDPTRWLSVAVVGAPQEDYDSGRLDRIWLQCQVQHVGDLEARWLAQAPVVEPRVWIDRVLRCATETGVWVPSWLSYDEMLNGVGTDPSDNELMNIAHQVIRAGCRPWES